MTDAVENRRPALMRVVVGALVSMTALVALGASSCTTARAAGPAWTITATATPTNFAPGSAYEGGSYPGPSYVLFAQLVGEGQTSSEFTISDRLPAGIVPATAVEPTGKYGAEAHVAKMTCVPPVGQVVTCTGGGAQALRGGEFALVSIPVTVSPTAAGVLINEATVVGGGLASAGTTQATTVSRANAPFEFTPGLDGFSARALEGDGRATTQSGAHPYELDLGFGFSSYAPAPAPGANRLLFSSGGGLRDLITVLPPGVVANPQAVEACTEAELETPPHSACPPASQVGTVALLLGQGINAGIFFRPLYNMEAPGGTAAEFGFEGLEGTYVHLIGGVRNDGRYVLQAAAQDLLAKLNIFGATANLWGEPSAASHDGVRGGCIYSTSATAECPVPRTRKAFLTMPGSCAGSVTFTALADSWEAPGVYIGRGAEIADSGGVPAALGGCESLAFRPSLSITPEVSTADSPSGLSVAIKVPQNEEYADEAGVKQLATANLKDVKVALPAGLTVNPSAADGLGTCEEGQIGFTEGTSSFNENSPTCPDASKIGTVEVETPLLDHTLPGGVYLAAPYQNPFKSLLALYVVIDDPQSGVVVKLAGHVAADQESGQLTTTFNENPQLPFSELRLKFFGGPRASLATPQTCGSYTSSAQFGSWAGGVPALLESLFSTTAAPGGGGCASSIGDEPNTPSLQAGTTSSQAGAFAPFVVHIRRADGTQRIGRVNTTLPLGLTGKLAGIPYCPEADIASAGGEAGRVEQASPSCPKTSEVGTVTVGAGVGPSPYYVTGKAYLSGPYKGAPLSLAIITPAVAGPFDLGTVVVRVALTVDPFTTQIKVESDQLPTILQGIPLDVRSISVEVDRPGFTVNPTDCEPAAVGAEVVSVTGSSVQLSNPFQVGNCKGLKFKPHVKLSLKGSTAHAGHPKLKAVVTYPQQGAYANIARAQVTLPHSEFIDQGNLNKTCTKPVLIAGNCPTSSIYGRAKAWTPLLGEPLQGPVYLVGGFGYKLPALVAELNGQVRFLLVGKVDSGRNHGIRNTFEAVPDAPVSRFVLEMKGGPRYSLLENSENLCRKTQRASARFTAQNGLISQLHPKISNSCKKKKKKGQRKRGRHRKREGGKRKPHSVRGTSGNTGGTNG